VKIKERFKVLIYDIKAGQKLGDDHMNAVNQLLHSQFEDFQGLSMPVLGQKLLFQQFDWMAGLADLHIIKYYILE